MSRARFRLTALGVGAGVQVAFGLGGTRRTRDQRSGSGCNESTGRGKAGCNDARHSPASSALEIGHPRGGQTLAIRTATYSWTSTGGGTSRSSRLVSAAFRKSRFRSAMNCTGMFLGHTASHS